MQNVWKSRFYLLTEQLHRLECVLERESDEDINIVISDDSVAFFICKILRKKGENVDYFKKRFHGIRFGLSSSYQFFRKIWGVFRYLTDLCRWNCFPKIRDVKGDVILVSVGSDNSLATDPYRDFLLGDLPEDLLQAGFSPVVFIHKLGISQGVLAKEHRYQSGLVVCGFGDLCSVWDAIYCIFSALTSKITIPKLKSLLSADLSFLARLDVSQARLSEVAVSIYYECALRRLRALLPNATIIHSWENQSWEHACRVVSDKTVATVGVQHNALLPEHRKMRADVAKDVPKPMPSVIITSGPESTRILVKEFGHKSERLFDGFDVRSGSQEVVWHESNGGFARRVLVLLQGLQSQVHFHNAVAYASEVLIGWNFILRAHPAVPIYENLLGSQLADLVAKMDVSESTSLIDDIISCDAVVYSGSTAVFRAVSSGVPVVHVESVSPLGNDPLFRLDHLVRRVNGGAGLVAAIREIEKSKARDLAVERQFASNYVREYFRPKNDVVLAEVISKIVDLKGQTKST
ncbi:hypothetical protein [Thalassospira sp.]|uniref:hypothetical protein n=1 Tax=Thalassospira sp. TaxID=1912094 RepID=UPI001B2741AB|nr:hypothetical protein [Thalassospira sp.]MBO6805947.1 hypothetical protein [Thalassospira sp.]